MACRCWHSYCFCFRTVIMGFGWAEAIGGAANLGIGLPLLAQLLFLL
nr:MAG TPA: hypothetical protein [Microviridae sp.]